MMPKGQIKFYTPTNLKRGQISEIWPKKGQSGNPDQPLHPKERARVICNLITAWHQNSEPSSGAVWVSYRIINCHCKK